jgi:archaellum component FlaC
VADFSFGGEGLMNAIALQGQMQQRQMQQAQFAQEQALFPYQLDAEQAKAKDANIKFLRDQRDEQHLQAYEKGIQDYIDSGQAKDKSLDQIEAAKSMIALANGLPAVAAEEAGKSATIAKDRVEAIDKQIAQVGKTKDIIASHFDGVRSQPDLDPAIDAAVMDLAASGAGAQKGQDGKTLLDQLQALKGKPYQQVKDQFTQRILTAEQQLTSQRNSVLSIKDAAETRHANAETELTGLKADITKMQVDFYKKNGYSPPGGSSLTPIQQAVLGALQAAHITVPGGMNGRQIAERVDAYMAYIPYLEGEEYNDYGARVADAATQGAAGYSEATQAGRRIGVQAGAVKIGTTAITEEGGLGEQYLDATRKLDFSSFVPLREGQRVMDWITSNPDLAALNVAAQGISADYSVVMGRGGISVSAQEKARELMNVTSLEAAQAKVDQAVKEMRAMEKATSLSTPSARQAAVDKVRRDMGISSGPPGSAPSSGWGPAKVVP